MQRWLIFFLLLPIAHSLSIEPMTHSAEGAFSFVTFDAPSRIEAVLLNHSDSHNFTFVTFERPVLLNKSSLLHSSKGAFSIPMNFSNRTDSSLSVSLPDHLIEGERYNLTFHIGNPGNQMLWNVSFYFMDHSHLFNLSPKEEIVLISSFIARNGTVLSANVTSSYNESNLSNNIFLHTVSTILPVSIESIDFSPETFSEGASVRATVSLRSIVPFNGTLYFGERFFDLSFLGNGSVSFDFIASNGTDLSFFIDGGTFLLFGSRKIITGLLPDLSGRIFSDSLLVSSPVSCSNFHIRVLERDGLNRIVREESFFVDNIYRNVTIALWNASHTLLAYLDYGNNIVESDEGNNLVFGFSGKRVYVDSEDVSLKDYAYANLKGYSFVNSPSEADIVLSIGRTWTLALNNYLALSSGWGRYDSGIKYYDRFGSSPYNGLVNHIYIGDRKYVFVIGNSISGTIAALKRFVRGEERAFIDDVSAVQVYDYLSLGGSIENALHDRMVSTELITARSSSGVDLRLLHISPAYSEKLVGYLDKERIPVVLARGLWSSLYDWQTFGVELADSGRDVYLIEITGGPGTDCPTCPNYDFDDLTDDYYPALINKVKADSGKSRLQYVGFSNGCRTALSSLQKGAVSAGDIETFVGVGCPGAFEGIDFGKWIISPIDEKATNFLLSNEKTHISMTELMLAGLLGRSIDSDSAKISLNLWRNYDNWMFNSSDLQPGHFTTNNFFIIQGTAFGTSDIIVTTRDEKEIYDSINITRMKAYFSLFDTHGGLPNNKKAKSLIKKSLNKENYTWWQMNVELKEMQVKS